MIIIDYLLALNVRTNNSVHILRLYGRTHERLDFKDPIYVLKLDEEDQEGKCQTRFNSDALHYKIREMEDGVVKEMEAKFNKMLQENIIPSLREIDE